jgi:hypothetical protein
MPAARGGRSGAARSRRWRIIPDRERATKSGTSIPDSADQTSHEVARVRTAARLAKPRPRPSSRASRQVAATPARWRATPSSLDQTTTLPGRWKRSARSAVHSGAVEPVTSSPGL